MSLSLEKIKNYIFEKKISDKAANLIAIFLLIVMFFLAIFSINNASITNDEKVHILSGYSYLTKSDYRLDQGQPPIVKDLSALPLLFLNISFPDNNSAWHKGMPDSEWNLVNDFIYKNNNTRQILFLSRLPMILIMILFGWFLFWIARKIKNNRFALFILILFTFSPNIIANGRLVTTDIAITFAIMLSIFTFIRFLQKPNIKNILLTTLSISFACLVKFSALILVPFFAIIMILYFWLNNIKKKQIIKYLKYVVLIVILCLIIISVFYKVHMINYPLDKQTEAMKFYYGNNYSVLENISLWMAKKPVFRPLSHYFFGVNSVLQKFMVYGKGESPAGGTYFAGHVTNKGHWFYYPVVYLIKTPLVLNILLIICLFAFLYFSESFISKKWLKRNFCKITFLLFILFYLLVSFQSKVNIGLRHILPIFPFIYLLLAFGIFEFLKNIKTKKYKNIAYIILVLLVVWYVGSSVSIFPYYLSYFNELIGGPENGYEYVVDSNLNWGQNLKRLNKWLEKQEIDKIYADIFPFSNLGLKHYLGDKVRHWPGACWWKGFNIETKGIKDFPKGNYLAVSATFLQKSRGKPLDKDNLYWGCYNWLNNYSPIANIGYSIFIYYIPG